MRPITLELQGFSSFREPCKIDFSSFDLFAITGQTGAGKTSLLDAMTYALYGKTSRLKSAGKDLISQGANAMSVSLHFRAGRDEYRVSRAIDICGATARLEKLDQGKWHGLSGNVGGIGQRVEHVIGLDFDAFTKSVILPQGKFDQFLRGSRKDQRETLNDLLGMQVYQRMVQSANEKKNLSAEMVIVKQAELDAAATVEAKAECERELARLAAEEECKVDAVDRLRQALPEALTLREKRTERQAQELDLEAMRTNTTDAKAASEHARQEMDRQHVLAKALDSEIDALNYDSELHVRLARFEQLAMQRRKLVEDLADQERRRSIKQAELEGSENWLRAAEKSFAVCADRLKKIEELRESTKAAFNELRSRHGSVDAVRHAGEELKRAGSADRKFPELRAALACLEARAAASGIEHEGARKAVVNAETEVEAARAGHEYWLARDRVAALRHDLKPGEPCPVCEQKVRTAPAPLDVREVEKASMRLRAADTALQRLRDALALLRAEAESLPDRIRLAHRECELSESAAGHASRILGTSADAATASLMCALSERIRTAESAALEAQLSYEQVLVDERSASDVLQEARHKRKLMSLQIGGIDDRAASLRNEIVILEHDLMGVPPLEEIVARLTDLNHAKQKFTSLEISRSKGLNDLREVEELALRREKDAEAQQNIQNKCTSAIAALGLEIARLADNVHKHLATSATPDPRDEAAQIDSLQAAGRKDLETVQAQHQRCRFAVEAIDEKIARNRRLREEFAKHHAEEALYGNLATWLNAGNFQQYLMRSAFERLAHEGSGYLQQFSKGRYTFAYNDKEFQVIDKWNGDDVRSVNTLSGGESFLASLSLALALAESIAELTTGGAVALESLFLDEGFSALDAENQNHAIEAIQILQGGKRLVGVITHIQSLADQMPARIEIERTLSGSRVRQVNV